MATDDENKTTGTQPINWGIPKEIREAYPELDLRTPIADFTRSAVWEKLEKIRRERAAEIVALREEITTLNDRIGELEAKLKAVGVSA